MITPKIMVRYFPDKDDFCVAEFKYDMNEAIIPRKGEEVSFEELQDERYDYDYYVVTKISHRLDMNDNADTHDLIDVMIDGRYCEVEDEDF